MTVVVLTNGTSWSTPGDYSGTATKVKCIGVGSGGP